VQRSALPIALAACLAGAAPASAGTITVTTLQINAPASECELDEAIIMVNDFPNDERFGCQRNGGGPDVIAFKNGLQGAVALEAPLPVIERTLTIRGTGADRLRIDGGQLHQVLTVGPGVTFALEAITLQDGAAPGGNGGALLLQSGAQATLRDCRITGSAAGNGGGIAVDGATLRAERCLIDGNGATIQGGGVWSRGGSVELVDTTVSGNTADDGGGLAAVDAGGPGTTALYSVTLADNGASAGGNAFVSGGSEITARHTVLASPAAGDDCDGPLTSLDWNLADDASCGLLGAHDQEGVAAGLAALADNGGPTATHALQAGSAAIDAGGVPCTDGQDVVLETDQRGPGFRRHADGDGVGGTFCDLGAYEVPEPGAGAAVAAAALAALARRRRRRVP